MAIATSIRAATNSNDLHDEVDAATPPTSPTDGNNIESHSLALSTSANARHALIAEAAYHRSQKRGFAAGEDWQDWFAAEREVDGLLDPDL
jgi:hypothetical protein